MSDQPKRYRLVVRFIGDDGKVGRVLCSRGEAADPEPLTRICERIADLNYISVTDSDGDHHYIPRSLLKRCTLSVESVEEES